MSDRYRDREEEEADLEFEEAEPPKRRGRLLAALIALFAIGGFGGVLWYAYSQGQRSADAVAPILKADNEPTRARPEQPGGMVVPHQDKLVLNNMQQANRGQVERLLPPAETPLPQTSRTAPPAASVSLAPPAAAPTPAPPPAMAAPSPPAVPPPAPATSVGSLIAPPAPPPVAPAPSSGSSASMTPQPPPAPAVVTPPPPPSAPPQMAARAPSPPAAAPPVPRAAATTGGAIGAGASSSWRVQLGSFPAAEQATAQWDRLKKSYAELQPLDLTTVRVDLGDKGVWYRLQAGPLNEPGARSLCEELKAKKRDCLVVRP
jgi:hypothetical protein